MAGGCGGCPPYETLKGESSQPLQPRHEWDPKRWQTLSPRGWANGGSRGAKPPWRGLWDVPRSRRLKSASLKKVGLRRPSFKLGVEGASPPPRGLGGCAPKIFKEGASCQLLHTRHEWDPKPWQTLSPRGWAKLGKACLLLTGFYLGVIIITQKRM
jgi:hypothetical protein